MEWWRWVSAGVVVVLLVILQLLWFDTLRDRPGWSVRRAGARSAVTLVAIPIAIVLVAFSPWWVAAVLIAVPAVAVITMGLAS
ncbi:MAG: hypothetical protein WKF57_18720 [Nakamurella sp.]